MIDMQEFKRWVATLSKHNHVAIDEGGLTVVELDEMTFEPTGAEFEVGGIPEKGDERTSEPRMVDVMAFGAWIHAMTAGYGWKLSDDETQVIELDDSMQETGRYYSLFEPTGPGEEVRPDMLESCLGALSAAEYVQILDSPYLGAWEQFDPEDALSDVSLAATFEWKEPGVGGPVSHHLQVTRGMLRGATLSGNIITLHEPEYTGTDPVQIFLYELKPLDV